VPARVLPMPNLEMAGSQCLKPLAAGAWNLAGKQRFLTTGGVGIRSWAAVTYDRGGTLRCALWCMCSD
jgi:hypothetical protein